MFLTRSRRLVSLVRSVWLLRHSRSKFLAKRWAAMVSRRKRGTGSRGSCWRTPSQLIGERSGFESFVPKPMSGRGGDADDATLTSQQGCKGSTDRQFRRRGWSSGSSSSISGEEKKSRDQDADIEDVRAQVEQLRRQQRVEKWHGAQGDSTRRESVFEEDWNTEVDEEIDDKKKLEELSYRRLRRRETNFCAKTRGCRKGLKRCKVPG